MVSSQSTTIDLLVVASVQDDAPLIESGLRNGGQAARAHWVATPDDAYDALAGARPDAILCADDITAAGALPVIQACHKRAPRVPLIVVSNVRNMQRLVRMMEAGARDVVSRRNQRHMEMVVMREVAAYRQARELVDSQHRLKDLEARYQALLGDTEMAVGNVHEGILTHANAAFRKLLHYSPEAPLEGAPLMDLVAASDRQRLKRELKTYAGGGTTTAKLRDAQGKDRAVSVTLRTVEVADEMQLELIINPADEDSVRVATGRDDLFAAFDKRVGAGAEPAALVFIHLDGGDELRSEWGLRNADHVADELRKVLSDRIEAPDGLYDFGFGEFVWLVGRARGDAVAKAAALRDHIAGQIFTVGDHSHAITISQAVGLIPAGGCNTESLLARTRGLADRLAAGGGNDVSQVEEDDSGVAQVDDGLWKKRIEEGLERDGFSLVFQTIASLEDDLQHHFDAFVRLRGGNGETMMPDDFLPSAERLGLDQTIDRRVLEQVLDLLAQRRSQSQDSSIFVKLSACSVNQPDELIIWLRKNLESYQVDATQLVFQARETLVRNAIGTAKTLAEEVRSLGCGFAIDRFGDSGQSLPLLDHLPVNFIKIAPHLTESLGNGQQLHVKLRQIMERAQELEIKTIAEYVQNANAMAMLWQLGVNFIQGEYVQTTEVTGLQHAQAAD